MLLFGNVQQFFKIFDRLLFQIHEQQAVCNRPDRFSDGLTLCDDGDFHHLVLRLHRKICGYGVVEDTIE